VASADGDVADSKLALVAATHFELIVVLVGHHNMHHSARVFLESQRFEPEEVFVFGNVDIDKTETVAVRFEHVRVWGLANLALKLLPHVGYLIRFLFDHHFLL
jgi:hypothetical protein